MRDFDVLVVGAGPAGSFAAERLAGAGTRVALFDGRPDGEPKACGGGVTAKALRPGHISWTPSGEPSMSSTCTRLRAAVFT